MKRKVRGLKQRTLMIDFDRYRYNVPIANLCNQYISTIDMQAADTHAPTIVFVHGYAGVAETWHYQLAYFSQHYRVVAFDLRGHGQSDAPYTRYDMPELVEDLAAVIEARDLPDEFVLVGHSFGAAVCAEYLHRFPTRVSRLVLVSATIAYPLSWPARLAGRFPTAIYRLWWRYRPRWNADIHVMKRMLHNNMRIWQGWDIYPQITTPTLVLTGGEDQYFPREVLDAVGEQLPNAHVVEIAGAKHKVQLKQPQAVNFEIEDFLQHVSIPALSVIDVR